MSVFATRFLDLAFEVARGVSPCFAKTRQKGCPDIEVRGLAGGLSISWRRRDDVHNDDLLNALRSN